MAHGLNFITSKVRDTVLKNEFISCIFRSLCFCFIYFALGSQ
jgi:hypothetical protein